MDKFEKKMKEIQVKAMLDALKVVGATAGVLQAIILWGVLLSNPEEPGKLAWLLLIPSMILGGIAGFAITKFLLDKFYPSTP